MFAEEYLTFKRKFEGLEPPEEFFNRLGSWYQEIAVRCGLGKDSNVVLEYVSTTSTIEVYDLDVEAPDFQLVSFDLRL